MLDSIVQSKKLQKLVIKQYKKRLVTKDIKRLKNKVMNTNKFIHKTKYFTVRRPGKPIKLYDKKIHEESRIL